MEATHIAGIMNPMPVPSEFEALPIVVAIAHPSSAYQAAATLAGAFRIKGYPIEAIV